MDIVHLHLALTHVPVIGIPIGLALLGWGAWRRSEDVVRVALVLLAVMGVAALAVYLTGEPAEEAVEHLAGVSEVVLESHEEAAAWSMYGALALGVMALAGLALQRSRTLSRGVLAGIMLAALAVTGSMAYTANLGGQIRHSEIRSKTASLTPTGAGESPAATESHDDSEDERS